MSKDNCSLKDIAKIIKNAKNIALFGHISPDIDCYGSMFGLYNALKIMGKSVQLFAHESFKADQAMLFDESLASYKFEPSHFDLLISVDTATSDRLGSFKDKFICHNNTIKIDHHKVGSSYAGLNYIDYTKSSCSEIIYQLLNILRTQITPEIATCLYSGLSADTGSFIYSNVNENSFEIGKQLFEKKANIRKINIALYQNVTHPQLAMKKYLYDNIEIIDNEIAIVVVPFKDMEKVGACKQDCENHSVDMVAINDINVSCAIIEKSPGEFTCSFRGKDGYNVSMIAQRLGGGGHVSAAGCRLLDKSATEVRAMVIEATRKYLKSRED